MKASQDELNAVVGIMKGNIEKVLKREEALADIEGKAEELAANSHRFASVASRLKRKFWWKNAKFGVIATTVTLLVIGIIVLVIIF